MKVTVLSVLCVLFALPLLTASPHQVLLDGEAGCSQLGGDWDGAAVCHISSLSLVYGTELLIEKGVTLTLEGNSFLGGEVRNRGTLFVLGLVVNGSPVHNDGLLVSRAWFHPHAAVVNEAIFENEGYLDVCSGTVYNRGYLHNVDLIENWGRMENDGLLVNDGTLENPDLGYVGIVNRGAVENNASVDNEGIILCTCGAAWYGEGALRGNLPEYEACSIADAIQRLRNESIALGPQAKDVLSKQQIIALLIPLDKASKWSQRGRWEQVTGLLGEFVARVEQLVDQRALPFHIGEAWVARARALMNGSPD